MRTYEILIVLFSLIVLSCLVGVEGQYYTPQQTGVVVGQPMPAETISQTAPASQTSQYSQYYTMGAATTTHITAPQPFVTEGNTPSTLYFGQQQQPVAYSQYESTPSTGNALWIKGSDSWAQYAKVPQNAIVTLLAISPKGGSGYLVETQPNGQTYNYNYFFYPASQLTFHADTSGKYTLSFVVANQSSNQVVIDVTGNYPPSYYNPSWAYPSTYYPSYYQSYYTYYYPYSPSFYPSYIPYYSYSYPYYYGYGYDFPNSPLAQELAWRAEAYAFLNAP